jgi:hypothetical protein
VKPRRTFQAERLEPLLTGTERGGYEGLERRLSGIPAVAQFTRPSIVFALSHTQKMIILVHGLIIGMLSMIANVSRITPGSLFAHLFVKK